MSDEEWLLAQTSIDTESEITGFLQSGANEELAQTSIDTESEITHKKRYR